MAVFSSILFKINDVTQNISKQAKGVQIRCKASKCVVNVWQWRTPAGGVAGERSGAAGQQGIDTMGEERLCMGLIFRRTLNKVL